MSYERQNIRRMIGYTSGEQPDDTQTIKLNTNENPYPPSPAVQRIIEGFSIADLRRYPPSTADTFRTAAAKLHGLNTNNIIATRGGDELLRLVITTFVNPGEIIAMSEPTYSLYPILAQIQDCPILKVALNEDWSLPEGFANKIIRAKAKLTLIVNPHAPSGYLLDRESIRQLCSTIDTLVLIDEAYVDFVDPSLGYNCLPLVDEFDNLIFLRSLSKGYSLAGLRFGYGIGHKDLITPMLEKTRDSYNLDVFSQRIATAALADQQYSRTTWQQVRVERHRLSLELKQFGLDTGSSEANFLLTTVPSNLSHTAIEIYRALKQRKILVRYFDSKGLSDKLRITVGTTSENDQLLGALTEIMM